MFYKGAVVAHKNNEQAFWFAHAVALNHLATDRI